MRVTALVTYKEWAAYRTHSLVSVFVGPAYFLVQVAIWQAIYAGGGITVNGMNLENMIAYYGISTLISYLVMDFADWNLQMLIHTGKYLTFALRPIHHRFFALSQKLGHRTLGFLFEFVPVLLIFIFVFRVRLWPASWFWSIISVAFAFLIQFYMNYIIGLTGFWLVKTQGLRSVIFLLTSVCSGSLFPLVLLPEIIQRVLVFLPFQYTLYVPSMVFTGNYNLGGLSLDVASVVGIQALYTLLLFFLSEILYRVGMKRFTAVGA